MPKLIFLLNEDEVVDLPANQMVDRSHGIRQDSFRDRLRRSGLVVRSFATPDQLELAIYQALVELKLRNAASGEITKSGTAQQHSRNQRPVASKAISDAAHNQEKPATQQGGADTEAGKTDWFERYRGRLPAAFYSYLSIEAVASSLSFYQSAVIPGLLQTADYARKLMDLAAPSYTNPLQIEKIVEIRMRRQREVLHGINPPLVTVILDEVALRRQILSSEIFLEQMKHIEKLAVTRRISLHILPISSSTAAPLGQFVVARTTDAHRSDAVYLESIGMEQLVTHPEMVDYHRILFNRIQLATLSEGDSLLLLRAFMIRIRNYRS